MNAAPSDLKRGFGFWTGSFVVVASMVGSGILTNSGPIVKMTGSFSALLFLWALGGVFAMCGALTLGELGSGLPRAGGDYVFVREAFGPACGFVYGWAMVLLGFAAPSALIAFTTASYLQPVWAKWFPAISEAGADNLVATALIILFTLFHCRGQHLSARIQITTTAFLFGVLALLAVGGTATSFSGWQHVSAGVPFWQVPTSALGASFILVTYAYTGWNAAVYLAGEIRDPQRLLPKCLALGCLAVMGLYMAVNLAYVCVLSPVRIQNLSPAETTRLAEVTVATFAGSHISRLFSLFVSLGVVSSLSAYILTGPRILYAMARDGLFPAVAGRVDSKTGTPVYAMLFQSGAALLFLWSGTFEQIMNFASYGLAALGASVVAPIFIMRRRPAADFAPRFRAPFYPWITIAFLATSALALISSARETPGAALLSVGSILVGFPIYWLVKKATHPKVA